MKDSKPLSGRSLLGEGPLNDEVAGARGVAFAEAARLEHLLEVFEHARAAANHHAVFGRVQRRQLHVGGQLAAVQQVGHPTHVAVRLARDGRVVKQLRRDHLAQKLMRRQLLGDVVVVGQLIDLPHAVNQHHLLELLISGRVPDDAHKGRQSSAGRQHVKPFAGQQVVNDQRAGGLATHDHLVAHLNMLQARSQRAVGYLDAQELQVFVVVGADDAVGAQQGLVVDAQPDHGEMAVAETQRRVTGGGEGKQRIGPVVHGQDFFFVESAHGVRVESDGVLSMHRARACKRAGKSGLHRHFGCATLDCKCSVCNIQV